MEPSRYAITTSRKALRYAKQTEFHRAPKTPGNILEALPCNLEVIWKLLKHKEGLGSHREAWSNYQSTGTSSSVAISTESWLLREFILFIYG
ncbi:hypothetical protein E3N88_22767 [Mikania micrantha]|uniref:Uncharacterized protein n=1 Tax=Mikania micrantha TaxID=192012 RepID=A0A5N6NBD5_9ASTR|nr:hypothetical protein E3N88_22767 [Mikania micrantha]